MYGDNEYGDWTGRQKPEPPKPAEEASSDFKSDITLIEDDDQA
jgi:hypothetical protein